MDDATIIETDTSVIQPDVAQDTTTVVEQPTVVDQATPMDSNTTYQNLPSDQITIDPNKDFVQNLVQDTIQIANNQAVNANAGQAMNKFLTQEYNYDPNEAGTYWVAGAINDKETQMAFLNTIINEEMYDEMDLNKYYYDTTMATARAYAAQKEKETAYGFYRAAQEKAIAEAQLTGWYMPAEGQYMLMNYEAAQAKLEDPDATPEEIAKAQRISGTTEQWFNANKIGPKGMKCLSMMNYEENVRHNTIMGELQKEANKIAASGAAASAAAANLQLRDLTFQLEEYELQSGHNITKELGLDNKDLLGHDLSNSDYKKFQALQGFKGETRVDPASIEPIQDPTKQTWVLGPDEKAPKDWLEYNAKRYAEQGYNIYQAEDGSYYKAKEIYVNALANLLQRNYGYYSAILNSSSTEWVNSILEANHIDAKDNFKRYDNDYSLNSFKTQIEKEDKITSNNKGFKDTGKTTSDGNKIVSTVIDNEVVVGYWKDGVWTPITDRDYVTKDGTTLNTYINNRYGTDFNTEGVNAINIDGKVYGFGRQSSSTPSTNYNTMTSDLGWTKVKLNNWNSKVNWDDIKNKVNDSQSANGATDTNGNTVKNLHLAPDYYEAGKFNEFLILAGEDDNGNTKYYSITSGGDLKEVTDVKKAPESLEKAFASKRKFETDVDLNSDNPHEIVSKLSYRVCYNKDEDVTVMAYPHSDGKVEYYTVEGNVTGTAGSGKSNSKIVSLNISEDKVKELGGKVASSQKDVALTSRLNTATEKDDSKKLTKITASGGSVSSGSSSRNITETNSTTDVEKAEYEEYVSRMESEGAPKSEILGYEDWRKGRSETINDVGNGGK